MIRGTKDKGKRVEVKDMTVRDTEDHGLNTFDSSLSFLFNSVVVGRGISAELTREILINFVASKE